MGLWGATDADEATPKWLTTAEKKEVSATSRGWEIEAGSAMTGNDSTSADREVLVAIGGLATSIGQATIVSADWNITTFDKSAGGTLSVTVRYNEAVTVVTSGGTPTITVTNDTNANHTLSYASGSTTNELIFTLVIAAANAATDADDVLSVAAQSVSLNSGTLTDSIGAGNAEVAISAAMGTACGTITVVA
jgi:hypothetical protein